MPTDIPLDLRAAVGWVVLEASALEHTLCLVAASLLSESWEQQDAHVADWLRRPGEPLRRGRAAREWIPEARAGDFDSWVQGCDELLGRRHRIVHGVFGYTFDGSPVFGFGRRERPEVIDVEGLEALALELHQAGVNGGAFLPVTRE